MQGSATQHGNFYTNGSLVKDDPSANAAELILKAHEQPIDAVGPVQPVTVIPVYNTPETTAEVVPNVAAIDTAPENKNDNTVLIIAAVGLGALLLMKNKKEVAGITGIGKGKKSSMLPLLLVGGAAAYYFYTQSKTTPVNPATTAPPTNTVVNTGPVSSDPQTQPPIVAMPEPAAQARSYTAQTDLIALQRDWPAMSAMISTFSDVEVIQMYNYFYNYLLQGKKLYRLPNATGIFPDGGWDTQLYDAVAAIKAKYKVNF